MGRSPAVPSRRIRTEAAARHWGNLRRPLHSEIPSFRDSLRCSEPEYSLRSFLPDSWGWSGRDLKCVETPLVGSFFIPLYQTHLEGKRCKK